MANVLENWIGLFYFSLRVISERYILVDHRERSSFFFAL